MGALAASPASGDGAATDGSASANRCKADASGAAVPASKLGAESAGDSSAAMDPAVVGVAAEPPAEPRVIDTIPMALAPTRPKASTALASVSKGLGVGAGT